MKRIKSAPANLASMTNNKKKTSISLLTKNNEKQPTKKCI